jgi:hypothetical protein
VTEEEQKAKILSDWIDSGASGEVPSELNSEMVAAAFVLWPELAPSFEPDVEKMLAHVAEKEAEKQAVEPLASANNTTWFGISTSGLLGVVAGAAMATLAIMGSGTVAVVADNQTSPTPSDSPFETVADKVDPMKPFIEPGFPSDGFKSPITEDEAGGVQVGETFDSAGWQVDGTIAKRATVYCGSAAIQRVRFAEGKVESNELMFSFVTPKGTADPLAAGQSITPNPQKAAEDLQSVLDAQFSLSGFKQTANALESQQLFCRNGDGRLVTTNAENASRVTVTVLVSSTDCVR